MLAVILLLAAAGGIVAALATDDDASPPRPRADVGRTDVIRPHLRLGCDRSVAPAPAEAVPGRDLIVGDLVLVGYRANATERPPGRGTPTRAFAWKLPIVVRGRGEVTISVPERLRRGVSLAYRAERPETTRLADGDTTVTFVACAGDGYTGWAGRILSVRRRCVTLEVQSKEGPVKQATVSLGAGRCLARPSGRSG